MSWEFRIKQSWEDGAQEAIILNRTEAGVFIVKPVGDFVLEKLEECAAIKEPTFRFPYDMARTLFPSMAKELDRSGIKPPERSEAEGELKSMRLHLSDMRRLVFMKVETNDRP